MVNDFKNFTRGLPKIQVAYDYDKGTGEVVAAFVKTPETADVTAQALISALGAVIDDGKLNSRDLEDDLAAEIAALKALNESYFIDMDGEDDG
jgi:hypothetical protein